VRAIAQELRPLVQQAQSQTQQQADHAGVNIQAGANSTVKVVRDINTNSGNVSF